MKSTQYVTRSLHLLTARQRSKLWVYLTLQIFASMLDIAGVLLMGLLVLQIQSVGFSSTSSTTSSLNWALPSNYLGFSESESLLLLLLLSVFCFSLKAIAAPFLQKKVLLFLGSLAAIYSQILMQRLFSQDIIFSQKRTTQESSFILTSASFLTFQGILGSFALVVSEFAIILCIVMLLLTFNLYLSLFLIAYFSLIVFSLNRLSKKIYEKNSKVFNEVNLKASTTVQEVIKSYREVFVSQKIEPLVNTLVDDLQRSVEARAALSWISLIPKYVFDTCIVVGIAIVGGFTYLVNSAEDAVSFVGLFLLCAARIMPSLLRLNTGIQGVQNCSDASNRLHKLVGEIDDSEAKCDPAKSFLLPCAVEDYLIEVDSLDFNYPGATAVVLDDLSFGVKKGEFLAVVGPSGSGKSTLVDLLIGVIKDPPNSIRIDDATPREKIKSSPGLIGYVPQNVSLFTRSLAENIALGVPFNKINQVNLERAVERAALSKLVNSLPLGLNTLVGENGYNFSGGQKQRIGLARAFYTDPEILILDEATSALDAETEHQISQMLSSLTGELTLIVVAHRLATVQKANKVLYLGGGGFSAVGSFEELRIQVPNFDLQAKLLGL